MEFYAWNSDNLHINSLGIMEPCFGNQFIKEQANNVLAIFPGIAFDTRNNRIGYGKGFYDSYFKNVSCYKIGICYSIQKVEQIETTEFDIKVDEIITN